MFTDDIGEVATDPCYGKSMPVDGSSIDDLVAALATIPGMTAKKPVGADVGGHPAKVVELTVDPDPPCPMNQFWLYGQTSLYPNTVDSTLKLWITEVAGKRFVIHTDQAGDNPQVEHEIQQIDKDQPISDVRTMDQWVARTLAQERFSSALLMIFAALALLLAAIGIYGVTSYAVSHRTREIGIRVALGASHTSVLRLILRQGLTLAAVGVAIGLLFAAAGSRLLENLLFGVQGLDPFTFAAACLLFIVVALVATYIPARRAALVDPMAALRAD